MTGIGPAGGVLVPQYADRLAKVLHVDLMDPPADRPFVLLLTGSRKAEVEVWSPVVAEVLEVVTVWLSGKTRHRPVLRQGGGTGIDRIGRRLGGRRRHPSWAQDEMPANWELGPAGGPIRNQAMVDKGADLCVGVITQAHSPGTVDCLARAHIAHIPRVVITVEDLYMPRVPPRSTW